MIVISCPHCGTRYQLAPDAIGTSGRKVLCAQCGRDWTARMPEPDGPEDGLVFPTGDEDSLDAAFDAAEKTDAAKARTMARIKAAIAPKTPQARPVDLEAERRRLRAFSARQETIARTLPVARMRRMARYVLAGILLALVGALMIFRTEIVREAPAMASLYSSVGLGVNVLGLEFEDTRTITIMREGARVMAVEANIRNVAGRPVDVPPVRVSVYDGTRTTIYEWSAHADAGHLAPGEVAQLRTQLTAPPQGAAGVRLSFINDRVELEAGAQRIQGGR
ncbi:zinc-ribbon domain-containing protein [Arsenicitalea aurantiaca]|nr:zinc-ribbon domain-containing protein [Arsenicitalea aurantiaca]